MKSLALRLAALATAVLTVVLLAGAAAKSAKPGKLLEPDKLVILSTTDVKGKTSPCG